MMTPEQREQRKKVKRQLDEQIAAGDVVFAIVAIHRERMFMMEQRKRSELALGSYLRRIEGWQKDLPEDERKAISALVQGMLDKGVDPDHPHHAIISASRAGSDVFARQEDENTWKLEYVAKHLPVWEAWAEGITGFGARSLGVVVGEAGDLSNYPDHSKLWKRMGVAVMDGIRQGGLTKGAKAEDWVAHGYSPKRRAQMYVIGDTLVKADGPYRKVFLQRCIVEHGKALDDGLIPATSQKATVESWAQRGLPDLQRVTKIDPAIHRSAGHMTKRAQRYIEKRLLRDLWGAWRRAVVLLPKTAMRTVPSAEFAEEARQGAGMNVPQGQSSFAPAELSA
jgi:hypothetical protein